ncbi:MAG: HAMP domain-containing histidine kinase [Lentisphaeraceae bacterium]|nr:HAMP domain-containing histidine kinase [Lentisphaeraceae bacterium]
MNRKNKGNILLYWVPALMLLLPAVYVIILLESTIDNEGAALKKKIRENYKSSLIETSKKLTEYWKVLEEEEALKAIDPLEIHTVTGADSAVIYDTFGKLVFPVTTTETKIKPVPPRLIDAKQKIAQRDYINAVNELLFLAANSNEIDEEGVALYEAAKVMKQIGKAEEALEICNKLVFQEIYRNIRNYDGDFIYLDSMQLLLELQPSPSNTNSNQVLNKLFAILKDYSRTDILTTQRHQLSSRLQKIHPELFFPLHRSEKISLDLMKIDNNQDRRNILQKTLKKDLWQYTVNGRVVLLFSLDNLKQIMTSLIQFVEIPPETTISLNPPGVVAADAIVSLDAANRMPGWEISLNFIDPGYMSSLVNQRTRVFRMTSIIVIAFSLVLGFLFLRDMRRKLHLADLKNDLVANVTHELKTPLASSRLLLDTLITQPELPREKIESYLTHLSKENTRLCRLVEHFLAFSKLEKNQYKFHIKLISLDELIDNLNEAIQGRFPTQKQRINYECTEEEVFIKGDVQSLVTVIVNLLENALKFSEEDMKVDLKIVVKDGKLSFSVRDEGIGISKNDQKRIFEQYFQADNKLSRKYEGSGLGLNIVKTVLNAHKSEIYIDSQPDKGSCFSFELAIEEEVADEKFNTHS